MFISIRKYVVYNILHIEYNYIWKITLTRLNIIQLKLYNIILYKGNTLYSEKINCEDASSLYK